MPSNLSHLFSGKKAIREGVIKYGIQKLLIKFIFFAEQIISTFIGIKNTNQHNAELQQADPGTKVTG